MSDQPYTKERHDRSIANLQKILDYCLPFLKKHKVEVSQGVLCGKNAESTPIVEISLTPYVGIITFLRIYWGRSNFLEIQFKSETQKPSESTKWDKEGNYLNHGHIQTSYSHESSDPEYAFNIIGLLNSVKVWEKIPTHKMEPH
jgi:hypothetical protein